MKLSGHTQIWPNEVTPADGGQRVLFAFVAQWPSAVEFCR